ncbi:MAG: PAS domain S-box protein [Calditrichaeota bacterium]|nr:MAG: PAS domain S-box protein [Calditrichota bacterium]
MAFIDDKELKKLRESEEKYRKKIEQAMDAIIDVDPETGAIISVNERVSEVTGFSKKELLKKKIWQLHPPDEVEEARELFGRVRSEGVGYNRQLHFLGKHGKLIDIDISSCLIEYGSKKIIQRICRDVSQRRKLEEETKAHRKNFETILNMMPLGLAVIRVTKGKPVVTFKNNILKKMFPEGSNGNNSQEWLHSPFKDQEKQQCYISAHGAYFEERELGNHKYYLFGSSYLLDADKSWYEIRIVQDVTEQRALENDLIEAKNNLEHRVEERTRQLKQKQTQLIQAEKMASLGNLVAGVAHEMNTPLGVLAANNDIITRIVDKMHGLFHEAGILEGEDEHTQLCSLFDQAIKLNSVNKTAAKRIIAIVNSLRKFARLDEAVLAEFDVHEGIDNTLMLVYHYTKNLIEIEKQYGNVPLLRCHPNQLNQVFMNILVNGIQAIEGKGKITIKTELKNKHVIISFTDSGKGIKDADLQRIFDPGFTTKGVGVGTGLGLSIVYNIIESHGGKIEVDSKVGKGTTFRFILPVRPQKGKK